ncbi:hypothetical protein GOP47_0008397 [Adiantum capillus-veneris]|uniref:Uncharacterized protein n=1 Tax=Adiantum capillus-veneris TaxID=13818 RepID=A0A9D4UZP6_ADICA|nr:hypothetical protein GOP47_0008397 [Adiantum capillus-veneris]
MSLPMKLALKHHLEPSYHLELAPLPKTQVDEQSSSRFANSDTRSREVSTSEGHIQLMAGSRGVLVVEDASLTGTTSLSLTSL